MLSPECWRYPSAAWRILGDSQSLHVPLAVLQGEHAGDLREHRKAAREAETFRSQAWHGQETVPKQGRPETQLLKCTTHLTKPKVAIDELGINKLIDDRQNRLLAATGTENDKSPDQKQGNPDSGWEKCQRLTSSCVLLVDSDLERQNRTDSRATRNEAAPAIFRFLTQRDGAYVPYKKDY